MTEGHWSRMARLWHLVGPPLRPAEDDLAVFQNSIDRWCATNTRAPRALILGVTPELYRLNWPASTVTTALDSAREMIDEVWPGPAATALQGSWTAMPLATSSRDIVVCDGGLGTLAYPCRQADLMRELHRILAPGGIFVVRLFAPTGRTGTVKDVFARLNAGHIGSLDSLKLQLWGALHGDARKGVRPRDVVALILGAVDSYDRLAEAQGWPIEHVSSLELHRSSNTVYHLTEAEEVIRMASDDPGGFECLEIVEPNYALGACCPIVTLRRC